MSRGAGEKDEIVLVRFESDLIEALEAKKKIRFDFELFNTLSLRDRSKSATVLRLLEAIIDYDAICPVLQFDSHSWTPEELKILANLFTKSKAITKIVLAAATHNAFTTIFEALESNTSVKVINILEGAKLNLQAHRKFYDQLCQSLINSNINVDTFELENFTSFGSIQHVDRLFDALKSTKSIRSLMFYSCLSIFEEKLNKFEELFIGNKQITSLIIDTYFLPIQAGPTFENILKDNYIKKFSMKNFDPRLPMTDLMASFSENTSITDLDLNYYIMEPMTLKDILLNNKTILKLDCTLETLSGDPIDNSIVDALEQNTSLTDLSINDAHGIERALLKNNALKRLHISDAYSHLNGDLFKKILLQNKTLTALDIGSYEAKNEDVDLIIEGLAHNSTLKLFGCRIESNGGTHRNFCKVMQNHQSITHLKTQDVSDISVIRTWFPGFVEMIEEEVLQKNQSLRSWIPYESFDQLKPYFKRNIKLQEYNIGVTKTVIRMICLKPQSFILPIEIWSLIFNQVQFAGVNIKFGELFYK